MEFLYQLQKLLEYRFLPEFSSNDKINKNIRKRTI